MALTPRQLIIQELLVQRQEHLTDLAAFRNVRDTALAVHEQQERADRAEILQEYEAATEDLRALIGTIEAKLRGDIPL